MAEDPQEPVAPPSARLTLRLPTRSARAQQFGVLKDEQIARFAAAIGAYLSCPFCSLGNGFVVETMFPHVLGSGATPGNRTMAYDDARLGSICWSVKSLQCNRKNWPKEVRIYSCRCSPTFNKEEYDFFKMPPDEQGRFVLEVHNAKVNDVAKEFSDLRVGVLLYSEQKKRFGYFEKRLECYDPTRYRWQWVKRNRSKNLYGFEKENDHHQFTWQPHGSQFSIYYSVSEVQTFSCEINRLTPEQLTEAVALYWKTAKG